MLIIGIAPFVVKKLPPKTLYVTCRSISFMSVFTIGLFAYFHKFHPDLPYLDVLSWIPLAMIISCVVMRATGIITVLHTLMSEVYPTEIRTQAIGITQASFLASGAIGVKFFPEMKDVIGLHGLCFLYTGMGIINAIWGAYTIPDNRGKSLVKVEEMYENKGFKSSESDTKEKSPNVV